MADIQNNFQTNLEAKLLQLAKTLDLSRAQVDAMIESLTSTTTTTIMVKFINLLALSLRFSKLSDFLN
jgi:HKD family nuclease